MPRDFGPARILSEEELIPNEHVKAALTAPGNASAFELEERVVDGKLIKTWKNLKPSMRDLWDFASQFYSDRQYLISEGEILTYSQVHLQSLRIANWLRLHHQVRKGDRIAIVARNIPEYVSSYWAVQMIGAVAVLVNAFSENEILAFCIADVDCRVVICDVERFERLEPFISSLRPAGAAVGKPGLKIPDIDTSPFAPKREGVHGFVVIPRKGRTKLSKESRPWASQKLGSHLSCFEELNEKYGLPSEGHLIPSPTGISIGKKDLPMIVGPQEGIQPEDNCQILFTSGTTGKPKGVLSTQRQCISCLSLAGYGGARALVARKAVLPPPPSPGLDQDQLCTFVLVPLFHTTGLQSALIAATSGGARLIMMNKWDLKEACTLIKKHDAQVLVGIGFMVRSILKSGENLPSLRMVSHGGASAAKEIPGEADKLRAGMLVGVGYGLTEVNGVAASLAGDLYHHHPTAVGLAPPAVDLKIVDPDTLVSCKDGDVGELWIKGPGVAKGYWNRPKATAESFLPDGWFRSGDLGKIQNGLLYIVDRAKDIIIRGGENISCSAVENAVYNEARILDCAAVALPDPVLGEKVAVICIPKDSNSIPTESEVIAKASKSLPKHAVPEFVWIRSEPLERNANGKVVKTVLRKEIAAYAEKRGYQTSSKL